MLTNTRHIQILENDKTLLGRKEAMDGMKGGKNEGRKEGVSGVR